jgi:hypothetical protein
MRAVQIFLKNLCAVDRPQAGGYTEFRLIASESDRI